MLKALRDKKNLNVYKFQLCRLPTKLKTQNRSCYGSFLRCITKCSFRLFPKQGGCGKYKSELPQICQRFPLIDTYKGKDSV